MPTPTRKSDLDTPCLVLDLDLLEGNLARMQAAVDEAGRKLRPHAKTHKCSALAKRQIALGAVGICAAKVSEARQLVREGLEGVLITGPVATAGQVARLVELRRASPSIMVAVGDAGSADRLGAAMLAAGLVIDVLLDIDVGQGRTGVPLEQAWPLAQHLLRLPGLRLRGVQAYAGHVQHIASYEQRQHASRDCLEPVRPIVRRLREAVPGCETFSVGGTGTFDIDLNIDEVTELQAGSYVCMDTEYGDIGSADDPAGFRAFAPALRVLTSVVSANHAGFVTVDAGLKAVYRDGGTPRVLGPDHDGLTYDWFGDEYGKVTFPAGAAKLAVGSRIELIPPHCDPTINLHDRFFVTRGDTVLEVWPIDLRGCSQ